MKVAQNVLLIVSSVLLVVFIALFVTYVILVKKQKAFDKKKMEKLLLICSIALFVSSIAFSIINIISISQLNG